MDRRDVLRTVAVGAPHLGPVLAPEPMTGARQDPRPPEPKTTATSGRRGAGSGKR